MINKREIFCIKSMGKNQLGLNLFWPVHILGTFGTSI